LAPPPEPPAAPNRIDAPSDCAFLPSETKTPVNQADPITHALGQARERWASSADVRALRRTLATILLLLEDS
jgi:hypothetical protein